MRKTYIQFAVTAVFALAMNSHAAPAPAPGASGYHVIKTIPVAGDDGWDYVAVDSDARRVYISHGTHVVVMNADTYAIEGDIPDTPGVHGIAIAADLGARLYQHRRPRQHRHHLRSQDVENDWHGKDRRQSRRHYLRFRIQARLHL